MAAGPSNKVMRYFYLDTINEHVSRLISFTKYVPTYTYIWYRKITFKALYLLASRSKDCKSNEAPSRTENKHKDWGRGREMANLKTNTSLTIFMSKSVVLAGPIVGQSLFVAVWEINFLTIHYWPFCQTENALAASFIILHGPNYSLGAHIYCSMCFQRKSKQCDRTCLIFGHLEKWNFAPTHKIYQSKFKILPSTIPTLSKWSKFFILVPKWRSFAKSGHTD